MNTSIIYDNSGHIYLTQVGGVKPQGDLNYLETDIPEGKMITSINTSVTPNIAILGDIPKTEIEILKEQVEDLTQANAELTNIIAMKNTNV